MRRLSSGNGFTPMNSSCRAIQIYGMTPKGADQMQQNWLKVAWNTSSTRCFKTIPTIESVFFTITDYWYSAGINDRTQTEGIGFLPAHRRKSSIPSFYLDLDTLHVPQGGAS